MSDGIGALAEATDWLLETFPHNAKAAAAGSVPYLKLWGTVAGGWQMARAALIAKQRLDGGAEDHDFYRAKIGNRAVLRGALPAARRMPTSRRSCNGSASVLALDEAQF